MDIFVAINLSVRQMWHGGITKKVLDVVASTSIDKKRVELEITESAMTQDPARMEATLKELSDNGLSISLDDFGTGYSSLNRLKQLPISKLKIDKSFVDGVPHNENDVAIVNAIIHLAQSFRLISLAEGIESIEQWRHLRDKNCQLGQGYLFSKPVPAAEIELMWNSNRRWDIDYGAQKST
ncbi:phytochrome-like protein cph2 [mine drainage metagenome]|uniref:Phytochrome-like protein cph2 n=1 Tax=mine drainage metagenome TaxID=410659 RepID=A0A1J5NX98_9ZZZZ